MDWPMSRGQFVEDHDTIPDTIVRVEVVDLGTTYSCDHDRTQIRQVEAHRSPPYVSQRDNRPAKDKGDCRRDYY